MYSGSYFHCLFYYVTHETVKQEENTFFLGFTRFLSFSLLQRCMVRVTNDNSAIGDWLWKCHFSRWKTTICLFGSERVKNTSLPRKRQSQNRFVYRVHSLSNDKVSDHSKLKASADDKISVTQKFHFFVGRVENIVGNGENAGYQHFLCFPPCFQKASSFGSLKVVIVIWLFPKRQIWDSSKRKELADDNFKFDENGSKFS